VVSSSSDGPLLSPRLSLRLPPPSEDRLRSSLIESRSSVSEGAVERSCALRMRATSPSSKVANKDR